jgi:hypothetical protein
VTEVLLSINQSLMLLADWVNSRIGQSRQPIRNRYIALNFRGALNTKTLESSINEIVGRHHILQIGFRGLAKPAMPESFDGQEAGRLETSRYVNEISDGLRLGPIGNASFHETALNVFQPFRRRDLEISLEIEHSCSSSFLATALDEVVTPPFDFEGPLIRFKLLRLAPDHHTLMFVVHPLVADGRSLLRFVRELASRYQSTCEGLPRVTDREHLQFWDFAKWERETLTNAALESLQTYWSTRCSLADPLSLRDLGFCATESTTDRPLLVASRQIDRDTSANIYAFCRDRRITPYTAFLSVLAILLHAYSGRERLAVIGTQSNRLFRGSEDLIGWFSNNHVLVFDLGVGRSISKLLEQVRDVVYGAYDHQHLPTFLRRVQVTSEAVPVLFGFTRSPDLVSWPDGLEVRSLSVRPKSARAVLDVRVIEEPDGFRMTAASSSVLDLMQLQKLLEDFHAISLKVLADTGHACF